MEYKKTNRQVNTTQGSLIDEGKISNVMNESSEAEYLLKLLSEDKKIQDQEFLSVQGDNQKTLELFNKRISLYTKYATESANPITQHIILVRRDNIILTAALVNTANQLQTDIAKLVSRMDEWESKR